MCMEFKSGDFLLSPLSLLSPTSWVPLLFWVLVRSSIYLNSIHYFILISIIRNRVYKYINNSYGGWVGSPFGMQRESKLKFGGQNSGWEITIKKWMRGHYERREGELIRICHILFLCCWCQCGRPRFQLRGIQKRLCSWQPHKLCSSRNLPFWLIMVDNDEGIMEKTWVQILPPPPPPNWCVIFNLDWGSGFMASITTKLGIH